MTSCKICSSTTKNINFGKSPIAGYRCESLEDSLKQPSFPLLMNFCETCSFGFYELTQEAQPVLDRLYSNHFPTYHLTKEIEDYHEWFLNRVKSFSKTPDTTKVLEIGCNSGQLLARFNRSAFITHGIEPAKTFADTWKELGIEVSNYYLNNGNIESIKKDHGTFDVIYYRHVLEHIEDPMNFISLSLKLLSDKGRIMIEVPALELILSRMRYENISFSHLNYFSAKTFGIIASKLGLVLSSWEFVEMDGGAILVELTRDQQNAHQPHQPITFDEIQAFEAKIETKRKLIHGELDRIGGKINAFGAGAKGQHLIHLLDLYKYIDVIYDDTVKENEKFVPGTRISLKNTASGIPAGPLLNLAPTHRLAVHKRFADKHELIDII